MVTPCFSIPMPKNGRADSLLRVAELYGLRWDVYDDGGEWRVGLFGAPQKQPWPTAAPAPAPAAPRATATATAPQTETG